MTKLAVRGCCTVMLPLLLIATGANAQNSQTPSPGLIPGLEGFRLPGERGPTPPPVTRTTPAPRTTPVPRATPTPRPVPRPGQTARPTPVPRPSASATPVARPVPLRPIPSPTPLAAATPTAVAPVAVVTPQPTPLPTPEPLAPPIVTATPAVTATTTAQREDNATASADWLRWAGFGLLALMILAGLGLAAWYFLRRRAVVEDDGREIALEAIGGGGDLAHAFPPTAPLAQSELPLAPVRPRPGPLGDRPTPAATSGLPQAPERPGLPIQPPPSYLRPKPAEPGPRARLQLTLRPIRAGTNVTSAAVDYEIELHNVGEVAARGIRLDIRLLSASADQDALLAALFAAPIDRPAVAPFDLDAGRDVALAGMVMLPIETISVLTMQGKSFFVPVMAINAVYHWEPGHAGGGTGQTANAYVVGIERGDEAKMAPFRVDTGPRMHEGVGQRAHSFGIDR